MEIIFRMMENFKNKIIVFTIILISFCVSNATSQEKIHHWFMLASTGDIRLFPKRDKALKNLSKSGEEAVPYLITQLGRKNIRKVINAERVLTKIGEPAVPYLIEALADTNKKIASISAGILGSIHDKRAIPPLMVAARHGYTGLRASACGALGRFDDTSAVPILIDALADTIPSVRREAAFSLGIIKDSRAIAPLFKVLDDSVYSVRYTAEYALEKIDTDELLEIALAEIDSAKPLEKYHIIVILGSTKSDKISNILEKYLQDQDYFIRGIACESLGFFRGNWRVANMLKRALWDNSEFVRMKAGRSLDKFKKFKPIR